jgi:hypothetical protein
MARLLGLARTQRNEELQSFVPDPSKSQINTAMTGTIIFKKSTIGGDVDITDWFAISVAPTADTTYYFNTDSNKTKTIYAGSEAIVFVYRPNISQVVFDFGAGTADIQGM